MRVSSYAVARPAYYDRNATSYVATYAESAVAPHAQTTRFTTTVAAGKKLLVESLSMYLLRDAVATVVGVGFILPLVTSAATNVVIVRNIIFSNIANANTFLNTPTQFTVYAGETFYVDSLDTSTGGSLTIASGAKGTLFDA